jgi:hypothetical protein
VVIIAKIGLATLQCSQAKQNNTQRVANSWSLWHAAYKGHKQSKTTLKE